MPYSEDQIRRLNSLFTLISIHKTEAVTPPTYRDSPYLQEMACITLTQFYNGTPGDRETLSYAVRLLRFLADEYDQMERAGVSVKYHKLLLTAYAELIKKYDEPRDQLGNDFFHAVIARNYYLPDDCQDLWEIVTGLLPEAELKKREREGKEVCRQTFRNDPVEMTDKYLAVIDEVERLIARTAKTPFCLERWRLKAKYLAQRGVSWTSPEILNPDEPFEYIFEAF